MGKSADQKCDKKLVSIGKYSNTKFNSQGFYHFIRGGGVYLEYYDIDM